MWRKGSEKPHLRPMVYFVKPEFLRVGALTLQSISIYLIRSHYLVYTKHLNLDEEKYNNNMRGMSAC